MPTVTYSYSLEKNNFTLNGWTDNEEIAPDVVGLDDGGFAVSYMSSDGSPSEFPLYSFLDSDYDLRQDLEFTDYGVPYAGTSPDGQGTPKVAKLNNGNVVYIWEEGSAGNGDNEIAGTIIGTDGNEVATDFDIRGVGTDSEPDVAALASGGFVVAWNNSGNVRTQVHDSAGAIVNAAPLSGGPSGASDVQVTGLTDGGFVVTYTAGTDIRAQIYNSDNTVRTADFAVETAGTTNSPAIAALPNGNWAVVYDDSSTPAGSSGISFEIFDANGASVRGSTTVDADGATDNADPAIAVLANGFIFITFTDLAGDDDIYGRLFDQDGNAIQLDGNDVRSIGTGGGEDQFSSVAASGGGVILTAWQTTDTDAGANGSIDGEVGKIIRNTVGDNSNEVLIGDGIADSVSGSGGNDDLQGRDGDDTLLGGNGEDTIFGQNGDDSLRGGDGRDTVSGAAGDDTVIGDFGVDELFGGGGEDSILGGFSNDLLAGNAGADTLEGQTGNDTIIGGDGDDIVNGGDGFDVLDGNGNNDTMSGSTGDDTMNGGNGNDSMLGGNGQDSLSGNLGADTLFGEAQNDFLNGGNGTDTVLGGSGNDTIFGGIEADFLIGEAGQDQLAGGNGSDVLLGDNGQDTIFGGNGNDSIAGGNGNDLITGNDANDLIQGNAGDDTLIGGTGNDTFEFFAADGTDADTINDFDAGPGVTDVIELNDYGAAFDTFGEIVAASTDFGANMIIEFGGGDSITLLGVNIADLDPDDFIFS